MPATKFVCLQATASGLSAVFLVLWVLNTFRWYRDHASPLHHFMTFALIFRLVDDLSTCLMYLSLDSPSTMQTFALLEGMGFTLYRSFLFTCFLLLSKGFATVRHTITSTELTGFTLAMGLLYITFSLYMLQPNTLLLVFLLTLVVTLFYCSQFLASTTQQVQHQLGLYRRMQILDMVRATTEKGEMVQRFQVLCNLYFLEELAFLVSFQVGLDRINMFFLEASHVLFEFAIVAAVFWTFRTRRYGHLFRLGEFGSFSEQAEWEPPTLYQSRPGLKTLTKATEQLPVAVLLPHASRTPRFPYENCEIGVLEDLQQQFILDS